MPRSGSIAWATRTCGPGITCTRSSATRTSRSSRAGRCSTPMPARPRRPASGLLVGANPFRNPGLVAKTAATLDHVSDGRAILGIGGAWMEPEATAHGIDFGTGFGQRLDWLDESVGAMRRLLDGESVTSEPGSHYQFKDLRHNPPPVQERLPIMIGGSGEKKTLRTVARYADMWNAMGPIDVMKHKIEVLQGHCDAVGPRHRRDRVHVRRQGHDPRHRSRGDPRLEGRDGAQQDAPERGRERHDVLERDAASSSPTGCGPTRRSASGRSSPSSRRRTTSRRSSASSARSCRSSERTWRRPGRHAIPGRSSTSGARSRVSGLGAAFGCHAGTAWRPGAAVTRCWWLPSAFMT